MSQNSLKVITFLSGKGGSGKTTAAISMAKFLVEIGYKCLLVDFDLATNGASYFFKTQFKKGALGIWEMMQRSPNTSDYALDIIQLDIFNLSTQSYNGMRFVPSRVNLNKKGDSYDAIPYNKDVLKDNILKPLIYWAENNSIDYIFIDCQAGYAISSIAAAEVADLAIITTEPDSISNDAAENLLIQMGTSLPVERRFLINKIDVRDAETYRNMRSVFLTLNRLPPLPFDTNVRNAFGARLIPINVDQPTPLLFALFETLKEALPETYPILQQYQDNHIDALFTKYDEHIQSLLAQKQHQEEELTRLNTGEIRVRQQTVQLFATLVSGFSLVIGLGGVYLALVPNSFFRFLSGSLWPAVLNISLAYITSTGAFLYRKAGQRKLKNESEIRDLTHSIDTINKELDQTRSLLWARSKEYLIDAQVSGTLPQNK